MKIPLLFFGLVIGYAYAIAQPASETTSSFTISGKVKTEKVITINDLKQFPSVELENVNTSCSPKKANKIKQVKAVLLKSILDSVSFSYEKSRQLNEFYFLFVAADGYKILFSFSEIYNTEIGNNLYVAIEAEGKSADELPNSILVLSTKDSKGGSRNMKWLQKIVVGRASYDPLAE